MAKPTSTLCKAVDLVRRIMLETQFGLCDGTVYKKLQEAKYTYIYCSSVKVYLMSLLSNMDVADVLAPIMTQLCNLLSESSCRIITPIQIDYNFIEVLPSGTCFDIEKKKFVVDPKDLVGSPRAFVRYQYVDGHILYPTPFIEGTLCLIFWILYMFPIIEENSGR